MPDVANPLTAVYDKLWAMVEARSEFTTLVAAGKRIKFTGFADKHNPVKDVLSSADCPELTLVTGGMDTVIFATSSTSYIERTYTWLLSTGKFNVTTLLDVTWAVFLAMNDWVTELNADDMTFAGKKFVTRLTMLASTEGKSDPLANRGLDGWSSIWGCRVRMDFSTADLQAA